LIMAMISSGVSGFTLSGRILNGSVSQSMSSSSAIGFSIRSWHLSMRVDSSIECMRKPSKEASKRSFEWIVRWSFQFTGSLKLPIYWKLPKLKNKNFDAFFL
jgi:hypothetical protein